MASAAFAVAMTFSAPSQAQAADLSTPVPAIAPAAAAPAVAAPAAALPADAAQVQVQVSAPAAAAVPAPLPTLPAVAVTPPNVDELVMAHEGDKADDDEQDCLAKAVYFEARGESTEGQLAVAEVVMNRAASGRYPPSLCKVVTQPAQFSFVRKGRVPQPNFASAAWRKAVGVARTALAKLVDTLPSGVLWYHADYVKPSWGRRLNRTAQIGVHIFYS
ncbi:cell wall hydrolase [Sphingomonas parva]|uniref:Cell wall hydrolase n=1 Tax=Sphingomonas parva TaxID=2555898 RepID=A0A4Y8ZP28_9SPHN|nr:cell wall hydrolase [Sphingomonas parva]TFI57012.1 cell wall hydrolase [Sphingomonas parva]